MDSNTDDTNATAVQGQGQDQDLQRQLESMVAKKDWARIIEMIQEEQEHNQQQQQQRIQQEDDTNVDADTADDDNDNDGGNNNNQKTIHILTTYFSTRKKKQRNSKKIPSLPNQLLMECETSEPAKTLFLMLVTKGGRDYVKSRELLHLAIRYNCCMEVVAKLLEIGGPHYNSLQYAIQNNASIGVVKKLVEVGGKDLVLQKIRGGGRNSFHTACESKASIDVFTELIEVGGKNLVFQKINTFGTKCNTLEYALKQRTSIEVLSKLIEVGGQELVLEKNRSGCSSFQSICHCSSITFTSCDILDFLILHGGPDVLEEEKYGQKPLHNVILHHLWNQTVDYKDGYLSEDIEEIRRALVEKTSFLIKKGIELQIGGEYSIGGLFCDNIKQQLRDHIYKYWIWDERVLPALKQVMAMAQNRHLPILQALIVNKAPPCIIRNAVNTFTDFINTIDSFDKYPLNVAIDHRLLWEDGTKIIFENSDMGALETANSSTGFYPFMSAALGGEYSCYDLDFVFHLIRSKPQVVKEVNIEKECSRKRKEC